MFVSRETKPVLRKGQEALYMFNGRLNRGSLTGRGIMFFDLEMGLVDEPSAEKMKAKREEALSAAAAASGISLEKIREQVVNGDQVFIYRPRRMSRSKDVSV